MKSFLLLLGLFALQVQAETSAPESLIKETNKQEFMAFADAYEWVVSLPKVSYIVEDNRDALGNGTFSSVEGYDCNRDGKVDEPETCVQVYKALKRHFNAQ